MRELNVWAFGCSHECNDVTHGSRPLFDAIEDSETFFPEWDIALDLGDHCNEPPGDSDGGIVQSQFDALRSHSRSSIYSISGNHDRNLPHEPAGWWFQRYLDPLGENPETSGVMTGARPFVVEGTWERYKFQVGNIVFLMMSDINRPLTAGRGAWGGDPGGVVSEETWEWWRDNCDQYKNGPEIVVTCHHYLPRETTAITGDYEGRKWDSVNGRWKGAYHGMGRDPKYASYLAYVDEIAGAPHFVNYMFANPGACALWLGAHNHVPMGTIVNKRGLVAQRWGCTFMQCAYLTRHHAINAGKGGEPHRRSRLLTFSDGSSELVMRHFMHDTTAFAPKGFRPAPWRGDLGKVVSL